MRIREGKISDIRQLHSWLNNTYELRGFDKGEAYSKSWLEELINDGKGSIVLVAENGKQITGFLIAHILSGRDIFLNDIFVSKKQRKKGIASELLTNFHRISENIHSNFALGFVNVKNKKMQNFLKKFDYKRGHIFYYYYKKKNEK